MRALLAAALSGLVFGLGLTVSHMIDPAKVLGFLDLAGDWDPSLAFVMLGAIPVAMLGFRHARRQPAPLLAPRFGEPAPRPIDAALCGGALLFGVGWGLVGYCPGPALAGLALGNGKTWIFVAAMIGGMALHRLWLRLRHAAPTVQPLADDRL